MGDSLENISTIDGRYSDRTRDLVPFFSEKALMKYRTLVEGEYLIFLSGEQKTKLREFSEDEIDVIRDITNKFSIEDTQKIKEFEKTTNHDVKAVEYFMKDYLKNTSLNDVIEWVHFGLTSYDVNNIAYSLMVRDGVEQVILPKLRELQDRIETFAYDTRDIPMLARTHGQPASPTTLGKEMKVFSLRLYKQIDKIEDSELEVKLNGATGNYNAHVAAYPDIDWLTFTWSFVYNHLNDVTVDGEKENYITLKPNLVTTQIEPYDSLIELFDKFKRTNNVLVDFDRDMWQYISDNWVVQKPKKGEVGSSTMPHKVNPIDFENSEGNLYLANGLFNVFGDRLQISRLQRDLTGSTIERTYGVAFAHCLIAYDSLLKGLGKVLVNESQMLEALRQHPEVITEGIQTILRREGMNEPYEKLSKFSKGNNITLKDIYNFVKKLEISNELKKEICMLQPSTYTGLASKIAKEDIDELGTI
jgi:adenylosuccinate lyase